MTRTSQFVCRTSFAIALIVGSAAVYYFSTRSTSSAVDLYVRIQRSNLPELDKRLMGRLVQTSKAWDTGLIDEIVGIRWRQVVWDGIAIADGKPIRIFIMDSYVRPASLAPAPVPLLCIVTDNELNLFHWETIADYSAGFLSASLIVGEETTLTITTLANWFHGAGTYNYKVAYSGITQIGATDFHGVDDGLELRPFLEDPPELREAIVPLRERFKRSPAPTDHF